MPTPILYTESPPLAPSVRNRWRFEASSAVEPGPFTLPPDPSLSLAVAGHGAHIALRIVRPHLSLLHVGIGPSAVVQGVRMRPEAAGQTGEVWFDAFTTENHHTRVQPTFTEDGFEWSMQPENGPLIHYVMRLDEEGRWVETGQIGMDGGTTWIDFFEMTLSRADAE